MLHRADQRAMRGLFVVEVEAVAGVADGVDALVEGRAMHRRCASAPGSASGIVGRRDRVLREGVQDVGQHQFLMLLLVVEADLDQRRELASVASSAVCEELDHRGIDMRAIGRDLVGARARQWPRWAAHAGGRR